MRPGHRRGKGTAAAGSLRTEHVCYAGQEGMARASGGANGKGVHCGSMGEDS